MASTGEPTTLWLICDVSGSMAETGKCLQMLGLARAVEQYIRLGYASAQLKLIRWNDVASGMEWKPDGEFPEQLRQCQGSAKASALQDCLSLGSSDKVLILSDGWWPPAEAKKIKQWEKTLSPDALRIIKIGGDANPQLRGDGVFLPGDFLGALDQWLPLPGSSPAEQDEGDEW